MEMDQQKLAERFRTTFGREPRLFRAPGRVNLIGEHTDYNEGFVLPIAIDRATTVAAAARADRRVRIQSLELDETREFDLDAPAAPPGGDWSNYVEGIARALVSRGVRLGGADLLVASDVPLGSGLSSSAALEIAAGLALWRLADGVVDPVVLARAGQQAEHDQVGARVGIMDQLTSALGRAGHAVLIDCRSLEIRSIVAELPGWRYVVVNSRIRHSLAASEYNTRRDECQRGVAAVAASVPGITALRDVDLAALEAARPAMDATVYRRCRHVVTENARTLAAAEALERGDARAVGVLMGESHESLRSDYEVSIPELDLLVALAAEAGAAGARMTGGGFGGCTINLVPADRVATFAGEISAVYRERTGLEPSVYPVEPSDGAHEIIESRE